MTTRTTICPLRTLVVRATKQVGSTQKWPKVRDIDGRALTDPKAVATPSLVPSTTRVVATVASVTCLVKPKCEVGVSVEDAGKPPSGGEKINTLPSDDDPLVSPNVAVDPEEWARP